MDAYCLGHTHDKCRTYCGKFAVWHMTEFPPARIIVLGPAPDAGREAPQTRANRRFRDTPH